MKGEDTRLACFDSNPLPEEGADTRAIAEALEKLDECLYTACYPNEDP